MKTIDIVIPVLNEERYIENCVKSVMAFVCPDDVTFQILIFDGGSTDKTAIILAGLQAEYQNLKIFDNKGRIQSVAMNMAIEMSQADYIMRLDAHSVYPATYLKDCLATSLETDADNVGGYFNTLPGDETFQAQLVQALTTHIFGVGNANFRLQRGGGPSDTVPYGFFKRTIFDKIGKFDERLVRAQDYEVNKRITQTGGRIWMNPEIVIDYYNQRTVWAFLKKQFFKEAPYNAFLWYLAPYSFAPRHAITGVFAAGLVFGPLVIWWLPILSFVFYGAVMLYAILALISSIQQAVSYKKFMMIILLPFCFFAYHLIHGLGVMYGLLQLATFTSPVQKTLEPWKGHGKRRAL